MIRRVVVDTVFEQKQASGYDKKARPEVIHDRERGEFFDQKKRTHDDEDNTPKQ
jgi:hypothetical protein